jgi:nitroimidazol reductase NimA-like FMN-containing flavoprotein (pyridoxamine 5'-phosphate oxidase superfamily)
MRLVSTPESEKRRFLASSPAARLVVYEEVDESYRSVIAIGTLERIDPDELTVEDIQQYGSAKRPLFEIWPKQKGDLDIELYRLTPETLSGRLVEVDREKN